MTRAALLCALLTALVAGSASAAPKARWQACGLRAVCATDDGGKHWRTIFEVPAQVAVSGNRVLGFLRWSASAGVVSLDVSTAQLDAHLEFWTRDRGAHWFRTDIFDLGFGGTCASSTSVFTCVHRIHFARGFASDAPVLFFDVAGQFVTEPPATEPFTGTYALRGWVPRRAPLCPGKWIGKQSRQVCWGAVANAGMSALPR